MTGDLVKWLRELGEHPCRSELPMGVGLRQAAIVPEAIEAENERLREALAMSIAEMMRASGRLDVIAGCNEDRRIANALRGTCGFARAALGESHDRHPH